MLGDSTRTRPVLIYDGDCAFCTKCVEFMDKHIPFKPVVDAWQLADLDSLGLTPAECERALQWVEPNGQKRAGAAAVGMLLVRSGLPWSILGWPCLIPPLSWVAEGAYRLIAANRHRLPGGTPACSMPAHLRPGASRTGTG
jgi:predicted DCC family thiol-disulfide oxidoreductase YuxK